MAFKMKGSSLYGSPLAQKKGKNYKSSKGDQQGPINDKQMPLQKGEMDGTWVYDGDKTSEKVIDYEERAGFLTDNDITNDGSKEDNQRKTTAKNLNREAQIIRDRRKNNSKKK
jgi:hypothetical protein